MTMGIKHIDDVTPQMWQALYALKYHLQLEPHRALRREYMWVFSKFEHDHVWDQVVAHINRKQNEVIAESRRLDKDRVRNEWKERSAEVRALRKKQGYQP